MIMEVVGASSWSTTGGAARACGFFFSSRRRHTRYWRDWSSDVCSSDLTPARRDRRGGARRLDLFDQRVDAVVGERRGLLQRVGARREIAVLVVGVGLQIGRASCRERV